MMTTTTEAANPLPGPEEGDLDVFISYSRRNAEFAYKLEELLNDRGLNVWLDKDDIPPSSEWRQEIEDGIQRADAVVIVVTPDLADSPECTKEIVRAEQIGKRIVPVLHIDVEAPHHVQEAVSKRNYIFWREDADAEGALDKIEESLKSDPEWTKNHTRINRRAILWEKKGEDKSVLERRTQLAEDEQLIALDRPPEQPQVTELMRRFIQESRIAERKRARRNLLISVVVTAVTSVIATIAVLQFLEAARQRDSTQSRAMASQATISITDERDLAALQALEAIRVANTTDARGSLLTVLATPDRFQRRIDVHDAPISATVLSDTGTVAATGDDNGTIWVWTLDPDNPLDPAEPRLELSLEEGAAVTSLALAEIDGEEGTFLAAVSDSGIGVVWRTEDGEPIADVAIDTVLAGATLSDDLTSLAGWDGDSIRVYDLSGDESLLTDEALLTPPLPLDSAAPVDRLQFSDEGTTLAWAQENVIFVWDWTTGDRTDAAFDSTVTTLEFGPGDLLAIGEFEGNIHLFDLPNGARGELLPAPVNAAVDLSFAGVADPFGVGSAAVIASAHSNGDINLSTVFRDEGFIDGFVDETLRGHKEVARSVAFGPELQLASGDFNGEVIWWNAFPTVALGTQLPLAGDVHGRDVSSAAFVDAATVVSLDLDGTAIETGIEEGIGTIVSETSDEEFITALDAGSGYIVSGLNTGDIILVDNGAETVTPSSHQTQVGIIDVAADGSAAVTASQSDGLVVIWDLETGTERAVVQLGDGVVPASALHSGGADVWLGVGSPDGAAVLRLDAATGEIMAEATLNESDVDSVSSLALSSNAASLAVGVTDRRIRLLDALTLEEREQGKEFEGHREIVTGITFTDGDETLISGDAAGVVTVWDVSSRRAITDLPGPTDGINDLEMSPDGTVLIVASEDDSVYSWVFDVDVWVERACALAGRNMTATEWDLYGPSNQAQVRHCPAFLDGAGDPAEYKTDKLVD